MEYNWEIINLNYDISANGLSNVVTSANWRVTATSNGQSIAVGGGMSLDTPDANNFIEWADITSNTALHWVHHKMGTDGIAEQENNAADKLNEMVNPTRGSGLPWESP